MTDATPVSIASERAASEFGLHVAAHAIQDDAFNRYPGMKPVFGRSAAGDRRNVDRLALCRGCGVRRRRVSPPGSDAPALDHAPAGMVLSRYSIGQRLEIATIESGAFGEILHAGERPSLARLDESLCPGA